MRPLAEQGISLLECMEFLPTMARFLPDHGIVPRLIRGNLSAAIFNEGFIEQSLTIHPEIDTLLAEFYSNITVAPSDIEYISVFEFESGLRLDIRNISAIVTKINIPHGVNVSTDRIYFAYPVRCQSRSRVRPVAAVEFFIRGG